MYCKLDRGICSNQYGRGYMTGCSSHGYCNNQITDEEVDNRINEQAEQEETISMHEKGLEAF